MMTFALCLAAAITTRGAGVVKNADGTETAKTKKDGKVFTIKLREGCFPVVIK